MAKLFGELLMEHTRLEPEKLERALRLQKESGERIGALLVQLGMIAERDVAQVLSIQLDLPLAQVEDYPDAALLDGRITAEFLKQSQIVPLSETDDKVVIAAADPLDSFAIDALKLAVGKPVECRVGVATEIDAAFQRQYGAGASSMADLVDEAQGAEGQDDQADIQHLKDLASEAPIIRIVNLMLTRALSMRASDIHIEPFESVLKIRYRIDGVLRDVEAPPARSAAAVISRIKVMAHLNIAERRLPQDGRIKLRIEGREIDVRVSTVPTMHGESVVMRLLDKGSVPLEFAALGFTEDILPSFREVLNIPHGIILVTGPTGSGKTTTLYAALNALNTPDKKILTVEDPVEYQLEGVNQIQTKPGIGLTFAGALRAILRQDPDVIMVGEMRDLETAKIAVQSALTGHKVFSTLHTNDAATSVTRMLDMGVEDYLLTSTVNGVLAQRLVRTLCNACREPYQPIPEMVEQLRLDRHAKGDRVTLYRPVGCDECEHTGYRGRLSILELLVMGDPVRQAVLNHADAGRIQKVAVEDGMTTMYDDGLRKALAGLTTIEEVERVTKEA